MRIDGEWYECDDGFVRPVIRGEILTATGSWEPAPFLVDTGADRTVFSAAVLDVLGFHGVETREKLGGVGGTADSVAVRTQIRLRRDRNRRAILHGEYAAFTDLEALDMSVLGRDITEMFAVIVDRPGDVVALLGQRHRYRIETI
jgi:hypothetical protein